MSRCPLCACFCVPSCSKRRMPVGVAEVAEQLQQLPLGSQSPHHQQQQQLAGAAPSDRPRAAGHHVVKRYRVAGPAAPPAPPAQPTPAAVGFRSPQPAAAGHPPGGCEPSDELMQCSPSPMAGHRTTGGLHPMAKSLSGAAAGGGTGRPPAGWGHPAAQAQQFMAAGMQQDPSQGVPGPYSFGPGSVLGGVGVKGWGPGSGCQQQQQACLNNMGGDEHMMQLGGGGGQVHGRPATADAFRCNSVNAMVQATVSNALFYA